MRSLWVMISASWYKALFASFLHHLLDAGAKDGNQVVDLRAGDDQRRRQHTHCDQRPDDEAQGLAAPVDTRPDFVVKDQGILALIADGAFDASHEPIPRTSPTMGIPARLRNRSWK